MSNAPETLGTQLSGYPAGTLYECSIQVAADGTLPLRVFIWHVNDLADGVTFELRVSVNAGSASIAGIESVTRTAAEGSDYSIPGICLADVQLYRGWEETLPNGNIGNSFESVIWNATVGNHTLVAGLAEFVISTVNACSVQVRVTYTSPGSTVPDFSAGCVPVTNPDPNTPPHIRGWWPHCEIFLPVSPTFDLNDQTLPGEVECGMCESTANPPPELSTAGFAWQGTALDQWGTSGGNKGLYGATANYTFELINTDPVNAHAGYLRILPRNNGGATWGAARITTPAGYPNQDIPPLDWNGAAAAICTPGDPGTPPPIILPAGTLQPAPVTLRVAPGGGASLPANLQFVKPVRSES